MFMMRKLKLFCFFAITYILSTCSLISKQVNETKEVKIEMLESYHYDSRVCLYSSYRYDIILFVNDLHYYIKINNDKEFKEYYKLLVNIIDTSSAHGKNSTFYNSEFGLDSKAFNVDNIKEFFEDGDYFVYDKINKVYLDKLNLIYDKLNNMKVMSGSNMIYQAKLRPEDNPATEKIK